MTKEEKQIMAIEIDKYFRSTTVNKSWFSDHLKSTIEIPNEGLEPHGISNVIINEESIEPDRADVYSFSATAKVRFNDCMSGISLHTPVKIAGHAETATSNERTFVKNIVLTNMIES